MIGRPAGTQIRCNILGARPGSEVQWLVDKKEKLAKEDVVDNLDWVGAVKMVNQWLDTALTTEEGGTTEILLLGDALPHFFEVKKEANIKKEVNVEMEDQTGEKATETVKKEEDAYT
ncbi:uncharacterized protein LOC110466919 [Mizuhopecten yessoensis]|uniref:uncharacterized protein LOC110466919 n=1 Tax=Mizuhopecten yessoensis TaxID=6573 RepID=UPI000B45A995|nr:uncharacterized protein LOC110466919 [Mizuhopecten yessoensis]XP_021379391.1 uncharacterized protein LOC110466919 [Mizuhopecten yessoensis]